MRIGRVVAIILVFGVTSIAWNWLGNLTASRSNDSRDHLQDQVAGLWGRPQQQNAPKLIFYWETTSEQVSTEQVGKVEKKIRTRVTEQHCKPISPTATDIDVALTLDERLRGLVWYSLYGVRFDGKWQYQHREKMAGHVDIAFEFPEAAGWFDEFRFVIDGVEQAAQRVRPENGRVAASVEVQPGQTIELAIHYLSRGLNEWRYVPNKGVTNLEQFRLAMTTDFGRIDFPNATMSPSQKQPTATGWKLVWNFSQMVTGQEIGMVTPQRLQPGELASAMSYSAPISLLFFFLILVVLGTLRGIDFHPVHFMFLAAAFFSFHLLFGYSVDLLQVVPAFVLSSVVSLVLVVSYLRLVVSNRFAFVEAALAQLIYLIGFSLAHFAQGYTGLTVTALSIVTLFVLMQLTGRIRWGHERTEPVAPTSAVEIGSL